MHLTPDADGLPPDGSFTMQLGGTERRFRFDFYALMRLEELTGENMLTASAEYLDPRFMSISRFCQLLWAMAVYDDPTLTPHEVARWITFADAANLKEQAAQAVASAMPTPEPDSPNGEAGPPKGRPARSRAG